MNKFCYSESKIAQKVGVSRYDMRNLRERFLEEGEDWVNLGGRKGGVAYSDAGMKSLASHLPLAGLDLRDVKILSSVPALAESPLHDQEKNLHPTGGTARESVSIIDKSVDARVESNSRGGTQTFTVFRIPPNPRIVLARDQEGNMQTVWVGRNQTFVVGDEIEVAPHEEQVNVWRFTGKLPRDKRRQRLRP